MLDNTLSKDSIILEIAEKENIANVLIGNFASQVSNLVLATTPKEQGEFKVGLKIASDQLGRFISTLIAENGNLKTP